MLAKVILAASASLGLGALAFLPSDGALPDPALPPGQGAAADPRSSAPAASAAEQKPLDAVLIPSRFLDCELGRITNFDPNQNQDAQDYRFEGKHRFRMFLPAAPARTTPPPSALKAPEPVDPRTRILADPDGLSRGASKLPFYRVVDLWPERVELVTPIADTWSNLVILSGYDATSRTLNLFMTAARDGMTFDQERLYAGRCTVTSGQEAERAAP